MYTRLSATQNVGIIPLSNRKCLDTLGPSTRLLLGFPGLRAADIYIFSRVLNEEDFV